MNIDLLKGILLSLVLCMAQALVFNHIHLLGVATPLICVYFVISFRRGMPRWALLVWAFLMGLLIDMFENTPGVTSASLTLVALLQPMLLELFVSRDALDNLRPGIGAFGFAKFCYFTALLLSVYVVVFFSLEMFTFFNWLYWLECIGGSWLITFIFILVFESIKKRA